MRLFTTKRVALVLLAFAMFVLGPDVAWAQNADGRPDSGDPGRNKPRNRTRPKKVIRGRAATDVEKVPTSSVIIRSYPPDAEVFVDGTMVGTTADDGELELSDVRLGLHRIVLKKDGYREWAQTVTLKSTTDTEEIEPLLQREDALVRDLSKLPKIVFADPATGEVTRDDVPLREGGGYYDEYLLHLDAGEPLIISTKGSNDSIRLKIVDDSNKPYAVERVNENVFHTVTLPSAGNYYLQVIAPIDESSFDGGRYSVTVMPFSLAHAARPIAVGETVTGTLDLTDRQNGPGEYYDTWTFQASGSARMRFAVVSASSFTPGLAVTEGARTIAASGKDNGGSKKKPPKGKETPNPSGNSADVVVSVVPGATYTIYVRSVSGSKTGSYQLTAAVAQDAGKTK